MFGDEVVGLVDVQVACFVVEGACSVESHVGVGGELEVVLFDVGDDAVACISVKKTRRMMLMLGCVLCRGLCGQYRQWRTGL